MFPRLREQIGTALDLVVEFSTLGEYRLAMDAAGAASAPVDAPSQAPQLGGVGAQAPRAAVRRTVAGGATGRVPVATPAARRSLESAKQRPAPQRPAPQRPAKQRPATHVSGCEPSRRRASESLKRTPSRAPSRARARHGAPAAGEQLCLAV